MPPFGPISRRALIEGLRRAGFSGPYPGGKHQIMTKGRVHLVLPNPHGSDVGAAFLNRILRQAGISREEWDAL
ncbi:MAG TPA: type II toxin-antitoxin system HicA family toxin [Chloroflexota bacterium]|jgi:predicted RNA binding protein YcfA (HicA-like mRNA interferase family)